MCIQVPCVYLLYAASTVTIRNNSDTSLRMDKNDSSRKIISFWHHWGIYWALFEKIFMFIYKKNMFWQFLIWQLLCKWLVTTADHSLLSMLYLYNSFFSRYVTPKWRTWACSYLLDDFRNFFQLSAFVTVPLACVIYGQVRSDHLCWSMAVTHHSRSDLRLSLIIHRASVKWRTAKAYFFKELKHVNGIRREQKYALAILNSSYLSLGIYCNYS